MSYNPLIGRGRGANLIMAYPQRLESADGTRWACGRNVKRSLPDHRYDSVEVWALKHRVNGKVVTVDSGVSPEEAQRWVKEGKTRWQS